MGDRYDNSKIEGFGQKQGGPHRVGKALKITVFTNKLENEI